MAGKQALILSAYQQTINRIDDYAEYRIKTDSAEDIRQRLQKYLDDLTKELKRINEG